MAVCHALSVFPRNLVSSLGILSCGCERDALQQRLNHVRPHGGLSQVRLFAEQTDHRLGELQLLFALQRRPHDRENQHPEVICDVRISHRHLSQGRHQIAHAHA